MSMKAFLKRSRSIVGVVRALRGAAVHVKKPIWSVTRRRRIKAYLTGDHPKKLNIGAGHNELPGWLNSDLLPKKPGCGLSRRHEALSIRR